MKKLLHLSLITITLISVTITVDVNASCKAGAQTWDQGARQGIPTHIYGYNEYVIKNETQERQDYTVCTEISTQKFDHSEKIANTECHGVVLYAGQSTGSVTSHPGVLVKYNYASLDYYVSIDSVTDIHGPCSTIKHDIKKLKVYR